ncbi:TetR/AcrR family transcriptional regulator [Glutamicibacter endophyticus]|uniref:TetR/AcrR family transcriptional regulator n=1 Tax=Glutamicibacter endophyticus TaxID=1522174 RepID=UPI003AF1A571
MSYADQVPVEPVKRPRGRPRKDSALVKISKDLIIDRALEIAGREGFGAVTMNRLAEEFSATPRALYNYVTDRDEVVSAAFAEFLDQAPELEFDTTDWRSSLRQAYAATRKLFRKYPRIAMAALEERFSDEVDERQLQLIGKMVQFFVDLGLDLPTAELFVHAFETDAFGFAMRVDYVNDLANSQHEDPQNAPLHVWWHRAADRGVAANFPQPDDNEPLRTGDMLFDEFVNLRVLAVEQALAAKGLS